MPSTGEVLGLRNKLLQSSELRSMSDLEKQLKAQDLSAEVSENLVSLLQVGLPM